MQRFVRFHAGPGTFLVALEFVREIRSAADLVPLPDGRAHVVGVLSGEEETLTVIDVLGKGRDHVIVVQASGCFGIHVQQVVGVVDVDPDEFGPAPRGQRHEVVQSVRRTDGTLEMVINPEIMWRDLAS